MEDNIEYYKMDIFGNSEEEVRERYHNYIEKLFIDNNVEQMIYDAISFHTLNWNYPDVTYADIDIQHIEHIFRQIPWNRSIYKYEIIRNILRTYLENIPQVINVQNITSDCDRIQLTLRRVNSRAKSARSVIQ